MKVLLPLVAFIVLGSVLQYCGLLLDLYIVIPYSLLGLAGLVGSYVMGQIYRRPLDPRGKAILITGCDAGHGFHAARALHALGFTVLAGCMDPPPADITDSSQSESTIILNQSESPVTNDQSEPDTDSPSREDVQSTNDQSQDATADLIADQEVKNQSTSRIKFFQLDITSDSSVRDAVNFVSTNLDQERLWAFIHVSGLHNHDLLELLPLATYTKHLDVNCLGLVRVTRAFLPLIRASQSRIINVMGYQARFSQAGDAAFSMCQHALLAFTDCLRLEMKPFKVKVITVETAESLVSRPEGVSDDPYPNGNTHAKNELRTAYSRFEFSAEEITEGEINRITTRSVDAIVQAVRSCRPRKRYLSSLPLRMEMWFLAVAPNKLSDWYKTRYRSLYRVKEEPAQEPRKETVQENTVRKRARTNSNKKLAT